MRERGMTNRERVALDRWLTSAPEEDAYCESCGDPFDPDSGEDFCPECLEGGLTDHTAIGELVVRLLSAGDLYITEIEELGYLVVWTSEEASVKAHNRELVRALERADENVQLM